MTAQASMGGGFGIDPGMSPSLRARVDAADREYDRAAREEERERQARIEQRQEDAIVASISAALDRGEDINVLEAIQQGGVGRTRQEALGYYSSLQDLEDRREEARQRAAFNRWQAGQTATSSGDMTAPTQLQLEEGAQMTQRAEKYRATRRERSKIINAARKFAAWDREAGR